MSTLDLGINVGDIFGYINILWGTFWPIIALIGGILLTPLLIGVAKSVFSRVRS